MQNCPAPVLAGFCAELPIVVLVVEKIANIMLALVKFFIADEFIELVPPVTVMWCVVRHPSFTDELNTARPGQYVINPTHP